MTWGKLAINWFPRSRGKICEKKTFYKSSRGKRYFYKLEKLAIVIDEIRIQNKLCNLKVNRFCIFTFQYSESQMKHLENRH